MASLDDLVTVGNNVVVKLAALIQQIGTTFPRVVGGITLSNATTTVVTPTSMATTARVAISPTNSTAASLVANPGVFITTKTATSFVISTVSGTAAGTETFDYFVVIPS